MNLIPAGFIQFGYIFLQAGDVAKETVKQMPPSDFLFALITMTSLVLLLMLWIILRLEIKMRAIEKKLDSIAENASEMVKMGMQYFRGKK